MTAKENGVRCLKCLFGGACGTASHAKLESFFFLANNRKVKTEKRLARNDDETTYVFKLITFAYVPSDRLAMVKASATSWYTNFVRFERQKVWLIEKLKVSVRIHSKLWEWCVKNFFELFSSNFFFLSSSSLTAALPSEGPHESEKPASERCSWVAADLLSCV